MRERAQLFDCRRRIDPDRLELLNEIIRRRSILHHRQLDLNGHQPLLGPVMKIALQTSSLAFRGGDDSSARGLELVVRRAQLRLEATALVRRPVEPCRVWEAAVG